MVMTMASNDQDSSANWEAQMLQATRIAYDVADILKDDFPTVDMYREFVMKIFMPGREASAMLSKLSMLEARDMQPYELKGFVSVFRDMSVEQYQIFCQRQVNLTGVGLSSFARNKGRTPRSLMVDELFIIGCRPGATGIIYGVPGSGKTNLAVGEIYRSAIKRPHTEVDCNVPIEDMPENAMYNGTLSGTLLHGAEFSRKMVEEGHNDYMVMWINDEAQVSRSRKSAMKSENMAMEQISMLSRKLGFFQWSILQQNKPTSEVRDFATHFIEKPSKSHPNTCDYKVKEVYDISLKLKNVQSAEERGLIYDSRSMLTYTVDINPILMLSWVVNTLDKTGQINTTAQYDAIIDYIKKHQGENMDLITDDILYTVLYRMRKRLKETPDWRMVTFEKLGKMVGKSTGTIKGRLDAIEKKEREGMIIANPEDMTDDVMSDIAGIIEEVDESEN